MGKHINKRIVHSRQLSTAQFIERCLIVHGSEYDYSKTVYLNARKPVFIICPKHGAFKQTPSAHMNGGKCIKCTHGPRNSFAWFLERACAAHGNKYDYSQTEKGYMGIIKKHKLTIICPVHGVFNQLAGSHLEGKGCKQCANDKRGPAQWIAAANGRICTLYLIRLSLGNEAFYKIGITYRTLLKRLTGRTVFEGYSYKIIAKHESYNAKSVYEWEQSILNTFSHLKYRPNIYFEGCGECFSSAEEILSIFPL